MPVRSFEIVLDNNSGFALTKTFDHLCHGKFTPGLPPPDLIAPNQRVNWASESDGFATGTEGYVKYRIEGNGDTVYIYWDNPFTLGVTNAKCQVSTADIEPDCDFDKTPADSTFAPPPSKFEAFQSPQSGGPTSGNTLELVGEVPLAPFFVFANLGIQAIAEIGFTIAAKPNNLRTFASRRRLDLSRGIRAVAPKVSSVRALMGLPSFG
jgi:hypothetical protein